MEPSCCNATVGPPTFGPSISADLRGWQMRRWLYAVTALRGDVAGGECVACYDRAMEGANTQSDHAAVPAAPTRKVCASPGRMAQDPYAYRRHRFVVQICDLRSQTSPCFGRRGNLTVPRSLSPLHVNDYSSSTSSPLSTSTNPLRLRPVQIAPSLEVAVYELREPADLIHAYYATPLAAADPFGTVLWPGALYASRRLYSNREKIKDSTVLILGAGTGLGGAHGRRPARLPSSRATSMP